jgi:ferredoxin-NAD(P)+ reductase (naphthalene dioxygenase ferredoxin-specific)
MGYSVKIRQFETPIEVEMGQTVLEAALAHGVPYPHGCRSGNCGACKSRLYAGDVDLAPHSEYALTEEERAAGLVLACRSVPWEDIEIGWLDEGETVAHPIRRMVCTVADKEAVTHDIVRVRLDIVSGGPFTFSAGQYAEVTFAGMRARDYSMANSPDEDGLEFHIRRIPDGAVSGYAFDTLKPGDEVRVEGPFGSAWLRESHRGTILALAGGSGLAPIKAIVEQALSAGMEQDIRLYFGVRDERDLYLTPHFEALAAAHPNLTFVPVLSAPAAATTRRTGMLHEAVAKDIADADGMKAYVAGPPPMVEAASALLEGCGIRREDIHADAFYTEAEKAELEKSR